jgi:putative CocE/NonD family hydrolase
MGTGQLTGEARYAVTETKDVLIPLSDGTRLAANLLLPDGAGPQPAIIVYFPYLKDGPSGRARAHDWQLHFASRGYACLTIDIRGTGASEGIAAPPFSLSEKQDCVEVLAWVAAQPWCDGKTGMWGISYSGSAALAAASMRPPSLKAIFPLHGTANEFYGFLRPHGYRPAFWTEATFGVTSLVSALLPPLYRDPGRRWARVWRDRLQTLEPWAFVWHTTPYEEYMSWRSDAAAVQAATYCVSSWHDYYPQATLDYFNAIPAPKRVAIGPWKHQYPDVAVYGAIDQRSEMDRWFDRWLKDVDNGVENDPPVMIWRQGEGTWGYENEWPPGRSSVETWYAGPAGTLTAEAPTGEASDSYLVDPTVGMDLLPFDPQGPIVADGYDRSGDDHRSLTYTSEALAEPLTLRGAPEAIVHLSADCAEFPLSVWLCDVSPDGHSTLICQGWISVARVAGAPLEPARTCELRVPLYSTSYRIAAGHRLRLGIAGSHFPLLWPAPHRATLEVKRSQARPTGVSLPIEPHGTPQMPSPDFGESKVGQSARQSVRQRHQRVVRELDGSVAALHEHGEQVTSLDDGAVLTERTREVSTVKVENSVETVLEGQSEATLEINGEAVHVCVQALQTNEIYTIKARITVNGTPFFSRTWTLPIDPNTYLPN